MSYSSLDSFRSSLGNVAPLSREEELRLAKLFAKGDEQAGEKMIRACMPFVLSIALEYRKWGVPLEDIVQQGNIGLLRAARKFDVKKECRLATYASYWIRAEIRDYVVRAFRVVRLGTTKAERRALRAYRASDIRDVDGLMKVSGLSRERVEQLLPIIAAKEASLEPRGDDEWSRGDSIEAAGPSPEEDSISSEFRMQAKAEVKRALAELTDRERMIVERRWMRDNEESETLQELGDRLGVSKERIRQIEDRVRGRLRDRLGSFMQSHQ